MKDTYYFTHDFNTRNDYKIKMLIRKHGMNGYGVFWAIIEELYNNANALQMDFDGIAYDLRVDEKVVESIINDFDLFVIDKDQFGSMSVQRRLDERAEKSAKARDSANKRWGNNADAMPSHNESNAIKEKKEKKKKEDKPVFSFKSSLINLGVSEDVVNDYLKVRKNKKATNTKIAFERLISEIDKCPLNYNDAFKIAVENSWSGFKYEWVKELKKSDNNENMFLKARYG